MRHDSTLDGGGTMNDRERIAFHEAAHVTVAVEAGLSVQDGGIDIDAPSSVDGAYGRALLHFFQQRRAQIDEDNAQVLLVNLTVALAGAVSDSKFLGKTLRQSLRDQSGDEAEARKLIVEATAIDKEDEIERILEMALKKTEAVLNNSRLWRKVETLAKSVMEAGGKLSKIEIEAALSDADRQSHEAR